MLAYLLSVLYFVIIRNADAGLVEMKSRDCQ